MPKMSIRKFNLSEIYKNTVFGEDKPGDYTLKIHQAKQNMIYGRILEAIEDK